MLEIWGPEPLKALLSRNRVGENRNLFCSEYERCLERAIRLQWVSWTCAHCLRYEALRVRAARAATRENVLPAG